MLASTHFGLTRTKKEDWFDTILDVDTELFVDPFLIFKEERGSWAGSHDQIVAHFNRAFVLIAEANCKPTATAYKKALGLLTFPEPKELCLGYTARGTQGAGSGGKFARLMAQAIAAAIKRGLDHPEHFEEFGILQEGIGADRISDATCTIIKPRLIEYTRGIAKRHRISCDKHRLYGAEFNELRQRFMRVEVELPTNPVTGGPLLFVPERFLDSLPKLNADDWWESYENERLRQDVNYEVIGKVDKATIVKTARAHMESVRNWAKEKESKAAPAYDFEADPEGVVQWEWASTAFTAANPLAVEPPHDEAGFEAVIERIIDKFRLFVEEQRGWWLLWDGSHEKRELAPQLIFYGIARNYCEANDISIDPEADFGRGPVDFKFSNGYSHRVHLEVKKLHNGKFWNGLDRQLPTYMSSDEVQKGWFLAVRYRDGKRWDTDASRLPTRVKQAAKKHQMDLRGVLVDARPQRSASKL